MVAAEQDFRGEERAIRRAHDEDLIGCRHTEPPQNATGRLGRRTDVIWFNSLAGAVTDAPSDALLEEAG
jgi:hypothetical protein